MRKVSLFVTNVEQASRLLWSRVAARRFAARICTSETLMLRTLQAHA